ncbi:uncharacterized protein LOC144716816 [Wolffia australiana]
MHAKTDSEVTSLAASSPPRSPRRPFYYVMSPSQHDQEKLSITSSPPSSPFHHHCHVSSSIHHSRESTSAHFSSSLWNGPWKKLSSPRRSSVHGEDQDEDDDQEEEERRLGTRCYAFLFFLAFFIIFSFFSLVLWGASRAYPPKISVQSIVFESYNIHPGLDWSGVPTKMLTLNSTVKISFENPATFFGVRVSSTPLELFFSDLPVATGHMKEFYQRRKSKRVVTVKVAAKQIPLYGGGVAFTSVRDGGAAANVPLNLTFVVRSRARVLGKLVKSKFYRRIRCLLHFREMRLRRPLDLSRACLYRS